MRSAKHRPAGLTISVLCTRDLTATVTATAANDGERWRTLANVGERNVLALKTTKVQAFGVRIPLPPYSDFGCPSTDHTKPDGQFDGQCAILSPPGGGQNG